MRLTHPHYRLSDDIRREFSLLLGAIITLLAVTVLIYVYAAVLA